MVFAWSRWWEYTARILCAVTTVAILCLNVVLLVNAAYITALTDVIDKIGYVFLRLDSIVFAAFIVFVEIEWSRFLALAPLLRHWPICGVLHIFFGSLSLEGYGMSVPNGNQTLKLTIQILSFFMIGIGVFYVLAGAFWHRNPEAPASAAVADAKDPEVGKTAKPAGDEAARSGDSSAGASPATPGYVYK